MDGRPNRRNKAVNFFGVAWRGRNTSGIRQCESCEL